MALFCRLQNITEPILRLLKICSIGCLELKVNFGAMLLMATSPGARGGGRVLDIAKNRFPFNGGHIVSNFSLPNFGDNFKDDKILDSNLNTRLIEAVNTFQINL